MQQVIALSGNEPIFLNLPDPTAEVLPAVVWGRFEEALTPAFWASQAWMTEHSRPQIFALGRNLVEEIVVCLLGGHGAPAEVGLAAFARVRSHIEQHGMDISEEDAVELLSAPLTVGERKIRYRFANQRGRYLAGCLRQAGRLNEGQLDDIALRDRLCEMPGIGLKTASWIVRNRRDSDNVAILDVHIMRACTIMGVFDEGSSPTRGYRNLEQKFLDFCKSIKVRPSVMDAVMWQTMRSLRYS